MLSMEYKIKQTTRQLKHTQHVAGLNNNVLKQVGFGSMFVKSLIYLLFLMIWMVDHEIKKQQCNESKWLQEQYGIYTLIVQHFFPLIKQSQQNL